MRAARARAGHHHHAEAAEETVSVLDDAPPGSAWEEIRAKVASLGDRLDTHRKAALARSDRVTMTGMYNVVEKLRAGAPLTKAEEQINRIADCGTLRAIHDELDRSVAALYGWPWPMSEAEILDRLVALHDERIEEERRGLIRWLRPDYQIPRFGNASGAGHAPARAVRAESSPVAAPAWPAETIDQILALLRMVKAGDTTVDEATARFRGADRSVVARHLDTLATTGEIHVVGDSYRASKEIGW